MADSEGSFSGELRRRAAAVLARRNEVGVDEVDPGTVTLRFEAAGSDDSEYGIDTWITVTGGLPGGGQEFEASFESYDAFGELLIALDSVEPRW